MWCSGKVANGQRNAAGMGSGEVPNAMWLRAQGQAGSSARYATQGRRRQASVAGRQHKAVPKPSRWVENQQQ